MAVMNKIFGILCTFTVYGISSAQIPHFGRCPDVPVVQNFDAKFYLGRWYEIEKYFTVFEIGGGCITADYSDLGNGTIGVKNSQIQTLTGQARSIEGTARMMDVTGAAKLGVTFPSVPFAGEAPYWVIGTDYKNYSIVWSCSDFGFMSFRIVWFLARERVPSEKIRTTVYSKLKELHIRTEPLQKTQQTNCPETPNQTTTSYVSENAT